MPRQIPRHRPLVRKQENPVSHDMEYTILDRAQLAFERIAGHIEREACQLGAAEVEKLAELVTVFALKLRRHRDGDEAGLLRGLVLALSERCAKQSELLSKCAENQSTTNSGGSASEIS